MGYDAKDYHRYSLLNQVSTKSFGKIYFTKSLFTSI